MNENSPAIEWHVTDRNGIFHGRLVNVWAAQPIGQDVTHQMFTFEVTGVGFGYSDIIDIGDSWSIPFLSIKSMRPL